jgi:hypothetical protein
MRARVNLDAPEAASWRLEGVSIHKLDPRRLHKLRDPDLLDLQQSIYILNTV